MKRTRKRQAWKRAGAVLLATVLAFGSLPEYGLVVHAQEQTETGGTEDTGYEQDATCTCGELCAEDHLNADCPVCGKDRADLNQCKGKEQTESEEEQTKSEEKQTKSEEEQTKSEEKQTESEEEQTKSEEEQTESEENDEIKGEAARIITAWEWIDEEEYLDPETGNLALPGASKEHPASFEDVVGFLPTQILATVENTENTEAEEEDEPITLGDWSCDNYPEDGAYSGSYTFTAALPEGYAFSEKAEALEITVELGGAEMYENTESGDDFTVTGGTLDMDYTYADGVLTIKSATPITIANADPSTATTDRIEVAGGVSANITLAGVNIDVSGTGDSSTGIAGSAAFKIADDSTGNVTITLAGGSENTLKSGYRCAGLQKNGGVEGIGKLTIQGGENGTGKLTARGGNYGAGIGGGASGSGSNIEISGGTVTATGGKSGAGIGGGYEGTGSNIEISGGTVTATVGSSGAGIGGGYEGTGSNIEISGGTVTATGGGWGAGIGGGWKGNGTNITISGGTVTATGGTYGGGIGGGYEGTGSNIEISGGTVTATGGNQGAGIGGGEYETGSDIKITGGTVNATGGSSGAGIGGGKEGSGSNIEISGGTVTATGGGWGAGIGGCYEGTGSNIEISGGTVTATGGDKGAGIGGGWRGVGSGIIISGGSVKAVAGSNANAIGGGYEGGGAVTPTSNSTTPVYLLEIANDSGAAIKINNNAYPAEHTYYDFSSSQYVTEKKIYAYLTGAEHRVQVGEKTIFYTFDSDRDTFAATLEIKATNGGTLTYDTDYDYADGVLTVKSATPITIANTDPTTATTDRIEVASGVSANITLAGVNIDVSDSDDTAAFKIADNSTGNVTITLADGSENTLESGVNCAGLQKNGGTSTGTLTIQGGTEGTGKLTATGGRWGAGIGGGGVSISDSAGGDGSNIIIRDGTVTATGGSSGGAGIGGGVRGSGLNITISGGTVTATGREYGAGIGDGKEGSGSDITISGGTVTAKSSPLDSGAGIEGLNITISGGTVTATGGPKHAGIGGSNITISGGTVTATSSGGAGIGSGKDGTGSSITMNGDVVLYASSVDSSTTFTKGVVYQGVTVSGSGSSYTLTGGVGTVYGDPNVSGFTEPTGSILGTNLADTECMTITVPDVDYTGLEAVLTLTVTVNKIALGGEKTLIRDTDYTASIKEENKTDAGAKTATITAVANSGNVGATTKAFTVKPVALSADKIEMSLSGIPEAGYVYDGNAKTPVPVVTLKRADGSEYTLIKDTDYTVGYSNNTDAYELLSSDDGYESGKAPTVTITAVNNGNFTGSRSMNFKIHPADMPVFTITPYSGSYDGANHDVVSVTPAGGFSGYTVYYSTDNKATWTATVPTITDAGTLGFYVKITKPNYKDWISDKQTATVASVALDSSMISFNDNETAIYYYTGREVRPEITVYDSAHSRALVSGTDYTVTYTNNTEITTVLSGIPKVTITAANGNYTGTANAEFRIEYAQEEYLGFCTVSGTAGDNGWYISDVTIQNMTEPNPSWGALKFSDSPTGTFADSYTVSAEGTTNATIWFRQTTTGYIGSQDKEIKIDKSAPVWTENGCGISVKENWWKSLLNTISFGLFYKDTTIDVKVCAYENVSGIEAYYYYIDASGSTVVMTASTLDTLSFTRCDMEGATGNVSKILTGLSANGKYVIYAYAVDMAGNRSGYVCTNGVVLDTTAPTISDITTPNKSDLTLTDTSAKISFTGSEAGTCFYIVKESSETAPASITDFATEQTNDGYSTWTAKDSVSSDTMTAGAGNEITLSNLSAHTTYTLYLAAVDRAGNSIQTIASKTFTTCKTIPTVADADMPKISGTYGQTVTEMTMTSGTAKAGSTVITGTWLLTDTNGSDRPAVGTTKTYEVTFTPDDSYHDKYETITVQVKPTVARKPVTVTAENKTKTYGQENPAFTFTVPEGALVGSDTKEALAVELRCEATAGSPVTTEGYAITGTSSSANYEVTVIPGTLTITKKSGVTVPAVDRDYRYSPDQEDSIDLKALLPADCGNTVYEEPQTVGDVAYVVNPAVTDGILSYTVRQGAAGTAGSIRVTASTNNYEDMTITVNLTQSEIVKLRVVRATAVTREYDGTDQVQITDVAIERVESGDDVAVDTRNLTGTIAGKNAGTYDAVTLPALTLTGADAGRYTLVQPETPVPADVTIEKAEAVITIESGKESYTKNVDEAPFRLEGITGNSDDAKVQYRVTDSKDKAGTTVSNNAVVTVDANGTVTIHGAGTATIVLSLPESTNYHAAQEKTVSIRVTDMSDGLWMEEIGDQTYNSKAIKPEVEVYYDRQLLTAGKDYTVSYKNNTNAASADAVNAKGKSIAPIVTIKGKGDFSGTVTKTFTINPINLDNYKTDAQLQEILSIEPVYAKYSGKVIKKAPTVKLNGKTISLSAKQYTCEYNDGNPSAEQTAYKDCGTYNITIVGSGKNFVGKTTVTEIISEKLITRTKLTARMITQTNKSFAYDGTKHSVVKGTDYTITDGATTLVEGRDYTVTYTGDRTNAGTFKVNFNGIGAYSGTVTKSFTIRKASAQALNITLPNSGSVIYTKGGARPQPQVRFNGALLTEGTDYTVTYRNNTKVALAGDSKAPYLYITGKGNFTGNTKDKPVKFTIVAASLDAQTIVVDNVPYKKKNNNFVPTVTITDSTTGRKLVKKTDYLGSLTYEIWDPSANGFVPFKDKKVDASRDNVRMRVTISATGNYTGQARAEYEICSKSITSVRVAKIPNQEYTGQAITPKLTITDNGKELTEGKDYTLEYSNNTQKGTASVTIRGKGQYGGSKTVKFRITSRIFKWS